MAQIPCRKKLSPLWWLGNHNDPIDGVKEDGSFKHAHRWPDKPLWIRKLLWALRNPLHNFTFFVIGFHDRQGLVNPGRIWPKAGFKHNIVLPFYAYRGDKWEFYIGWRSGISLGFAFRKIN